MLARIIIKRHLAALIHLQLALESMDPSIDMDPSERASGSWLSLASESQRKQPNGWLRELSLALLSFSDLGPLEAQVSIIKIVYRLERPKGSSRTSL